MTDDPLRVGVFLTHPIQYWSPILRGLADDPSLDLSVYYLSDHSIAGGFDAGFGRAVKWDTPLLHGYRFEFLTNRSKKVDRAGFFQYRASGLASLFQSQRFDAVLVPGYGFYYYLQVIATARRFRVPVLLRGDNKDAAGGRSALKTAVRDVFLRFLYRSIAGCAATSKYMIDHFRSYGVRDSRIFWAPHCIDTAGFEIDANQRPMLRTSMRQRLGIESDDVVVAFVGRLLDWKEPQTLVRGFASLPRDLQSRCKLLVVGSGPCEAEVRALCEQLIPGRAVIFGFANQTELPAIYAATDLFVLPSARGFESWGLVVNEAMTSHLPVILSDGVGCRGDLVRPGENGDVFEAGNVAALAQCLERWLSDGDLRHRAGQLSKEIVNRYSVAAAVAGLRQAIRGVTDRASA